MNPLMIKVRSEESTSWKIGSLKGFDQTQDHHKMKQDLGLFNSLTDEILTMIITFLAISADGATGLACLAATRHKFHDLCGNPEVLKVANFEDIDTDDYEEHHHPKDLLCICARVGNPGAESMMGKAIIRNDAFFWRMILEHDMPLLAQDASASGLLLPRKLVRRFISDASDEDIATSRIQLFTYMVSVLGKDMAELCGILLAVANMCCFYLEESVDAVKIAYKPPRRGLKTALCSLTTPSGEAHRAKVLKIFDVMITGNY